MLKTRNGLKKDQKEREQECFVIKNSQSTSNTHDVCLTRYLSAPHNHLHFDVKCHSSTPHVNPSPETLSKTLSETPVIVTDDFMLFMADKSQDQECITPQERGLLIPPISNVIIGFCHKRTAFQESPAIKFAESCGPMIRTIHVESFPIFQTQGEYNFYCRMTSLNILTITALETSLSFGNTEVNAIPVEENFHSSQESQSGESGRSPIKEEPKVPLLRNDLKQLQLIRDPALPFRNLTCLSITETLLTPQSEAFFVSLMKCQASNPNLQKLTVPMGLETSCVCWNSLSLLCTSRIDNPDIVNPLELNLENFFFADTYRHLDEGELSNFLVATGSARNNIKITGVTWTFLDFGLATFGMKIMSNFTSCLKSVRGWGNSKIINKFPFESLESVKLTYDTMDIDIQPWNVHPTWDNLQCLTINITDVTMVGFIDQFILDGQAQVRKSITSLHIRTEDINEIHAEMFPDDPTNLVRIFPKLSTLTLHIPLEDEEWRLLFTKLQQHVPELMTLSVQGRPENTDGMLLNNVKTSSPLVEMECLRNFQFFAFIPIESDREHVNISDLSFQMVFSFLHLEQLSFIGPHGSLGLVTAAGIMALTKLPCTKQTGLTLTLKVFENSLDPDDDDLAEVHSDEEGENLPLANVFDAGLEDALDAVRIIAMNNRRSSPPLNYTLVFADPF